MPTLGNSFLEFAELGAHTVIRLACSSSVWPALPTVHLLPLCLCSKQASWSTASDSAGGSHFHVPVEEGPDQALHNQVLNMEDLQSAPLLAVVQAERLSYVFSFW